MKIVFILAVLYQIFITSVAIKILSVFSYCAHSHYSLGYRLAKELADRGHDVTLITCHPQEKEVRNLKEIGVKGLAKKVTEWHGDLEDFAQLSYVGQIKWLSNVSVLFTEEVLKSEGVQKLMNSNETFDIVLQEHFINEAMTIFHHRFNCPLILLAPGPATFFNNHLVANPAPPSYVPNILSDHGSNMTLWQRLENTYRHVAGELLVHFLIIPEQDKVLKKIFPNAPDLSKILYNASLLFLTTHVSLEDPVPLQQNIKVIGGYHISPAKPLPEDIKKFLDEATEGVVLFSMGSNLKSSDFDLKRRKALLNAFSKIKQKVLWKFEEDLHDKPQNVRIMKWLPQQGIMAHPNVVAFISHGGLLGTLEALHYGVPILGLPVFWDQMKNIQDAARKGFAVGLDFKNIDEKSFKEALNKILNNPSYRKTAKKYSRILHDQPMKQMDEAVFWIEYVVRHEGAHHLRSIAVHLPWYQIYLIDIILLISTIVFVALLVIMYLLKALFLFKEKRNKVKKH